ncbi:MAG: hypothetical protein ACUVXA_04365 [Candidatus Jordarchaeum sp.]|uniref:hypothetical protein n=1 Tax=Candidatus Jordarchaeum sp. TaxID=2823881 RepID=UPI00404A46CC
MSKMEKAYRASWSLLREKMEKERKEDLALVDEVKESDIIVVRGQYDFIENVFQSLGIPHTVIDAGQLGNVPLSAKQLLLINCPGNLDAKAIEKVRGFVRDGGFLFTTDWSLKNVLEQAFPGYVEYNNKPTGDEVVKIEILDAENPLVKGVVEKRDEPVWWLEGSSYPIRVLNKDKVRILIRSKELKERYDEEAVAVTFTVGGGRVIHMISHYYLQRSEFRTDRQMKSAEVYAAEKGITPAAKMKSELKDLSLGEVESAYSSAQFFANILVEKKKQVKQMESEKEEKGSKDNKKK